MKKIVITTLACLSLLSCASNTMPPTITGPSAEIIIPAKTAAALALMQDAKACLKREWLAGNSTTLYIKEQSAVRIPADQLVTLYLTSKLYSRKCETVFSFKPEAGQRYVLEAKVDAKSLMSSLGDDLGQCTYALHEEGSSKNQGLVARHYQQPYVAKNGCDDALSKGEKAPAAQDQVIAPFFYNTGHI